MGRVYFIDESARAIFFLQEEYRVTFKKIRDLQYHRRLLRQDRERARVALERDKFLEKQNNCCYIICFSFLFRLQFALRIGNFIPLREYMW